MGFYTPLNFVKPDVHNSKDHSTAKGIGKAAGNNAALTSPLRVGKHAWSAVQVDLNARTVKHYDWDAASLGPYQRFAKLYGERKFQKADPRERQTISFQDLPGEIRNKIYGYALNFGTIELATKSSLRKYSNGIRKADYRLYKLHVKPALRLLRVNKAINAEAASVFYGQNEFRFSSFSGHDILRAFCKTIGRANTCRLEKITQHAPVQSRHEIDDRRTSDSKTYAENFGYWLKKVGLNEQGHLANMYPIERTITGKHGSLEEYKMVISCMVELESSSIDPKPRTLFEHLAKCPRGLKISLVLLDMDLVADQYDPMQLVRRLAWKKLAIQKGWNVIEATTDKKGHYLYPGQDGGDVFGGEQQKKKPKSRKNRKNGKKGEKEQVEGNCVFW